MYRNMTQTRWRIQNIRETWYFQDAYLDAHGEILSHGVFVQNGSLEIVWDKTLLLPILCDYKYNGSSVLNCFLENQWFSLFLIWYAKEDIWSVPQCTMLLCYSGSTSHNAQCFHDDHDQFSQFSPHCRIHVHSSIILKDTVWIAEFSWFSSLFGIFKALLSLDNLNR